MGKNVIDELYLELSPEEMELFSYSSTNAFFNHVYNSDQFKNIISKIDSNDRLNNEEWKYILSRLFLVTCMSNAEYECNKLDFKDRLIKLICRIGMVLTSTDSGWYNEFYKMFEYMNCFDKLKFVSDKLYGFYLLVKDEKNEELLKIYINQHQGAYDFREYRSRFMECYSNDNQKAVDNINSGYTDYEAGLVSGDIRSNINMMNRAYDSTKKLVLKYQKWYNTNIDCEEE